MQGAASLPCCRFFQPALLRARRVARQTGTAKAGGYLLLTQPAERQCCAPEVPFERDGGGNAGFYCLKVSDSDLPSTSPNLSSSTAIQEALQE